MMDSNKSQGGIPRRQNFSSPGQCPKSTTLAGLPPPQVCVASLSDSFIHSLNRLFIHSFIQSAELELIMRHACCQALGMWRWGSPWSQGPLYSLHSSTVGSPPGSERSPSRVLQDPSVPQSLHSVGRGLKTVCGCLDPEGGEKSYFPSPCWAKQGK